MEKRLTGEEILVVSPKGWDSITYEELAQRLAEVAAEKPMPIDPAPANPPPDIPPPVEPDGEWKPDGAPVGVDTPANATKPTKPGQLVRVPAVSAMSTKPWGYNRLQRFPAGMKHKPRQKPFAVKLAEVAQRNAPGFPSETPALLEEHGVDMFDARNFYGDDGRAPWGLPTKDMRLFYEITGGDLEPYRSPFKVLTAQISDIGANLYIRLPRWNTVPENGLIDGVATVKEAHINAEYEWMSQSVWDSWNEQQRKTVFFNYQISRYETLETCYGRGGIDALSEALHQKWRNYFGLIILVNNFLSPGITTYYGDHSGIAPFPSIQHNVRPANTQSEETCNAGKVEFGVMSFDVSGNLRGMSGVAHLYNYESYVTMSVTDFEEFQTTDKHDINYWHDRMTPDLLRPYNFVDHALETIDTMRRKGWPNFRTYLQTEPIYEDHIKFPERDWQAVGAWVPWTLQSGTNNTCKIPLHPEVAQNLVILARFLYQGFYSWGKNWRQDLPAGKSENSHPELHNTGREGFQVGLDQVESIDAFGPNSRVLTGSIPIWNEQKREYVAGDPATLMLANGDSSKPLPLVIGVYDPDTGVEAYGLYYPNEKRDGSRDVRFKSPINGAELTGTAQGWGITLYQREHVTETV